MDASRKGKIASLPAKIRDEINRRLHDGETARQILPWLNADTDVLRVLDERWHEQPVDAHNLSQWRQGGYQDWLNRNEKVSALKVLSEYSLQLAQAAGGSITEGAAAIAGGRILELLENSASSIASADAGEEDGEGPLPLNGLIESLVNLRRAEIAQRRTDIAQQRVTQNDRALALEEKRFQRQTGEYFRKFYKDERVREIMERKAADPEVQVQDLVKVMFGEKPSAVDSSKGGEPG